jgi:hypothetical protein
MAALPPNQSSRPTSGTFTVANIFVIAGAYAYLAGWQYVTQLRYDFNITALSLTDLPINQIYAYAVVVMTRETSGLVALAVLGFLIAVACWKLGNAGQQFGVRTLIVLYAGFALYETIILAAAAADQQFESMKNWNGTTRVKFMLTQAAKHQYDRFFIALNERARLRVLEVGSNAVLVLRVQYIYPSADGARSETTFSYRVPNADFRNAIYYTPPAQDSRKPDLALPPAVWDRIATCQCTSLIALDGRAIHYRIDGDDVVFDSRERIERDGLAQAYVVLPDHDPHAFHGLVRHPDLAYRLLARLVSHSGGGTLCGPPGEGPRRRSH